MKWRHLYNGALIYVKNIFHLLTFQTSNLPKRAAKNKKNMTSFPCFVRPEKFHPYMQCACICNVREKKDMIYMVRNDKKMATIDNSSSETATAKTWFPVGMMTFGEIKVRCQKSIFCSEIV